MPERPYHHGNLREALLVAAERALARDGAAALSLRELAREVGVSHAAPRRHFADRDALLDALAERGFARLGDAMTSAVDEAPDDLRARLRAVGRSYFGFATAQPALLDVMYAGKHRPGADGVAAAAAKAFATPLRVVEQAVADGQLRSGDVAATAALPWAAVHGLASLAVSGLLGDREAEALVDQMVDALVDGLRASRPSAVS